MCHFVAKKSSFGHAREPQHSIDDPFLSQSSSVSVRVLHLEYQDQFWNTFQLHGGFVPAVLSAHFLDFASVERSRRKLIPFGTGRLVIQTPSKLLTMLFFGRNQLELLFNLARDFMFSSVGSYVVLGIAAGRWFGSVVRICSVLPPRGGAYCFRGALLFCLVRVRCGPLSSSFVCGLVSRSGAHLRLSLSTSRASWCTTSGASSGEEQTYVLLTCYQ